MKQPLTILVGFALAGWSFCAAHATNLDKLRVLYVGDAGTSRAGEFEGFLRQKVAQVAVGSRGAFKPAEADNFDVVLLDWPQSERTREEWKTGHAPLGERGQWTQPTVLLGSAGLNLAVVWKVRGGSG